MSDLDHKLDAWRRATETAEPSPELMAELAGITAAAAAGAATGAAVAKTAVGGVKAAVVKVLLASLMTGVVAGSVWFGYARLPSMMEEEPAPPAPGANGPRSLEASARPAEHTVPSAPNMALVPAAPAVRTRVDIIEKRMELPPRPAKLEQAIAPLTHTCAGERETLDGLIEGELGHAAGAVAAPRTGGPFDGITAGEPGHDADAVAAALARETMLCRKLNGTGPAWHWPWKLIGECPVTKECPSGGSVNESIANAEKCLAASAQGSCERRAARLQEVFAWCERVVHDGSVRAMHQKLGEQIALLEAEFGKGLEAAAWCENLQAQAEPLRMKQHAP
jgi:hypothetical protein